MKNQQIEILLSTTLTDIFGTIKLRIWQNIHPIL